MDANAWPGGPGQLDLAFGRAPLDAVLRQLVDHALHALDRRRFEPSPIFNSRMSQQISVAQSIDRRHGTIIQLALAEILGREARYLVWREPHFVVSQQALQLAGHRLSPACESTTLPYGEGDEVRELDLLVFDRFRDIIGSYEVKRGHGMADAGKQRQCRRDLQCCQMLLLDYARKRDMAPRAATARLISYYGKHWVPRPWLLTRDDLDEHFGISIREPIERMNSYLTERISGYCDAA